MNRKIITTGDGSTTIYIEDWDEQYHSIHGAIQEANHVFIKHGLHEVLKANLDSINILEIGFGTGLNTFITCIEAEKRQRLIHYFGIEGYPIIKEELEQLNYDALLSDNNAAYFNAIHETSWEAQHQIHSNFTLTKHQQLFSEIVDTDCFNLIYFDAFGAKVQPELWTEDIFKIMFNALKVNGILVTYSAKGSVRRAMQAVGFTVERLGGPPGKREMLRARKTMRSK